MSYTKGPFKTERQKHCLYFVLDEKKRVVAECYGQENDSVRGNAMLFSAAPELVEALEMLLNETNAGLWDCLPVEKAKQALTKAKGGQP